VSALEITFVLPVTNMELVKKRWTTQPYRNVFIIYVAIFVHTYCFDNTFLIIKSFFKNAFLANF